MNSSRRPHQTGYRLILGVFVNVFAIAAFAADCKVNDTDISDEFVGGCLNGLAHGKGKAKGRDTYDGEFKQGNKHGKGTYIWAANSIKYEGEWLNGRMHGKGIMIWPSGNKYEGDWLNNKSTGKATFIWANGDKYVGDFLDGKRTGNGLIIWPDGSRYEGEYRDGKRHGFGELRFVKSNEGIQDHERQAETRGRWVGDIYVVKGLFVANEKGSDFILSCASPQNCKQEQDKREVQERREAADRVANACNAFYSGRSVGFKPAGLAYWGSVLDAVVLGKGNGNVSIKIVDRHFADDYGKTLEMSCTSDQLQ